MTSPARKRSPRSRRGPTTTTRSQSLTCGPRIADILTFYQERIANEGYLRTARLRDSVLRMARLLDYQLQPGVAAMALLAFTLDKDATLTIPVGLRVQSVPGRRREAAGLRDARILPRRARLNRLRVAGLRSASIRWRAGPSPPSSRQDPTALAAAMALSLAIASWCSPPPVPLRNSRCVSAALKKIA